MVALVPCDVPPYPKVVLFTPTSLDNGGAIPVVVTVRPEGKKEQLFVEEVLAAFG